MVKFNLLDEDTWETIEANPERSHYAVLPIEPQVNAGRTIGASSLLWWINQIKTGHPNTATIFSPNVQCMDGFNGFLEAEETLIEKLQGILDWIGDEQYYGWGKPAHFDLPKTESVFATFGMEFPIPWFMYRCMSSAKGVAKVFDVPKPKFKTKGNVDHHALWDATEQVLELQGWFQNMKR